MRPNPAAAILALSLVGGCGPRVAAPSLAPRAIERQAVPYPDEQAEPASAADPALAARIATIVASAEAGHRRYQTEQRAARAASRRAAGSPEGSDAWIAAQQAASALVAARGGLRQAAAAIDALRAEPAYAGAGDRAAIDAAAARIDTLLAAEQDDGGKD